MALWGTSDTASNSCIYAAQQVNKTANTANQTDLYGNTTADAFISGLTIGQFGVAIDEMTTAGFISAITVTDAGTGYTARPTVSIAAPDLSNGVQATATAVGAVVDATVSTRGDGYDIDDVLTGADGTGTDATFTVTNLELATIAIGTAGSGYANGETVTVVSGTGTAATATVTTGAADTIPASLTIATRGDYTEGPTLTDAATTSDGSGTGLTVDLTMGVKTVAITTPGAYTVLPTLSGNAVTGGTGTGAELDLVIGVGETITITNAGSGYSSAPDVTFGGTGGSGSTATATVQSESSGLAHAGWVLRTEGSGGRAGRVHYECLVAMGTITGDGSDDAKLPE